MKQKRWLAVLLSALMVVALLPTAALAAEEPSVNIEERVGEGIFSVTGLTETYGTLDEAIDAAASYTAAKEIVVNQSVELTANNWTKALPAGITLRVANNSTLTVGIEMTTLASQMQGALKVEAGSSVIFNTGKDDMTSYIGAGDDYYFNLTKGSMTVSGFQSGLEVTLEKDSAATIPAEKNATLMMGVGVDLIIEEDAVLDVNGGLRGVSGSGSPSAITVNGTLDATDGLLSMSDKATMAIGTKGSLIVGAKGISSEPLTEEAKAYTTADKITVVEGGKVVISKDNKLNVDKDGAINLADYIDVANAGTPTTDADGNIVLGNVTEVEGAVAQLGNTQYATLKAALDAAEAGDVVSLVDDVTIAKDDEEEAGLVLAEGVTLNVGEHTLDVSAIDVDSWTGIIEKTTGTISGIDFIADATEVEVTGSIAYDLGTNTVTVKKDAVATINGNLQLSDNNGYDVVIEEGATVASSGLNLVSGRSKAASLTIDGTLTMNEGSLSVGEQGSVAIGNTGSLVLAAGQDLTAIKTPIALEGKAGLKLGTTNVNIGEKGRFALAEDSTATVTFAEDAISLDVNGDMAINLAIVTNQAQKVDLVIRMAEGSTLDINANVTVDRGSLIADKVNVNAGSTLTISKDGVYAGETEVYGVVNIQNSEANKDLNVTGASFNLHKDSKVYAMGELADTMFSDAAVTEIEEDAEGYSDGYRYLWSWQFGLTPIAEGVTIERATTEDGVDMILGIGAGNSAALVEDMFANMDGTDIVIKDKAGKEIAGNELIDTIVGTGFTVTLIDPAAAENEQELDSATIVVTGDVNGDSLVDVADLMRMANHVNETAELTGIEAVAAMANSDDVIDIADLMAIAAIITAA